MGNLLVRVPLNTLKQRKNITISLPFGDETIVDVNYF